MTKMQKIAFKKSKNSRKKANLCRVDMPITFINEAGLKNLVFEVIEPKIFEPNINSDDSEVNVFNDYSRIAQLICTRQKICETNDGWRRMFT